MSRVEPAASRGVVDDVTHCQRLMGNETGNNAGGNAADTFGFATIVTECELVEIGLQMFVAHGAGVSAQKPALQVRDRPVAALQGIFLAPFGF